jgi:proteasome accessory factor C
MSKPTTPLEQTARLLDLVPFLLAHQGISLDELADHFNVESEVMIDDLNTLWMCGLPGYTPLELIDLAFDSGFVTIRNAAPLAYVRTMSSSEVVSLALGLDLLRSHNDRLDKDQVDRIDRLSSELRNQIGVEISIAATPQTTHRSVIAESIKTRTPVEMSYYSASSDSESSRIVSAYDFFYENETEYFRAYCHTAKAMRTFRVDRILSAALTTPIEELSLTHESDQVSLRIEAGIRRLDRSMAEAFDLEYRDLRIGDSVIIEAFSPEWLIRSIMAGAGSLVVENPEEIRLQIKESIASTMALYE